MPRLAADSSLVPKHVKLESTMSHEEDAVEHEQSQGNSPSPPHDAPYKPGSNGGAILVDPKGLQTNINISNRDATAENGSHVLENTVFISSDEQSSSQELTASTGIPATNGGSGFQCEQQVPQIDEDIEKQASESSLPHQDIKLSRHIEEGNSTQAPEHSSKLNPKKKTGLPARLQSKVNRLEKDKVPSPKPAFSKAKDPAKESVASPRVPSPGASAVRSTDVEKGEVEPLSTALTEQENGKAISPDGFAGMNKGRKSFQDSIKVNDKAKPRSLTSQGKRLASFAVKAPDNSILAENANDREKVSPVRASSPTKAIAKATYPSHHKPLQVTPPLAGKIALPVNKASPGKPSPSSICPESPMSANKSTEKKIASDQERTPESDKPNQKSLVKRKSGVGSRKFGDNESVASSEYTNLLIRENPNLGPYLLKLARQAIISGDNPQKALDYASRAAKSYETAADGKPSLELVMSLHILAATHCTLGQFEEAIPVLQHSIAVTDIEAGGQEHALAAFAGNMQLGDTYSLLGRGDDALAAYYLGLEIQKKVLGEMDPRVGETCRYLAEAHTQAMQFDQAEALCQHALNIHKEHSAPASIEEAADRRLMGLIYNGKGEHEAALEHLVLASMALIANTKDIDVAAVDTSIGDTYVSLGRFDEAVFSYQKALTVLKASKGENHVAVGSVYVSLAELYLKTGKFRECKTYCDSALRIFNKQGSASTDEVASGLTELAAVFEALNEQEQALLLLKKALSVLDSAPGQQSSVAGVEAQIGVLSYMGGNYADARSSLSNAVSKLRGSAERSSALFGIVLNQMGLCCLHLAEIRMAAQLFEESRNVMESACGPHHPDTLTVYSNLAGAYDALGRLDDAISALQHVVEVREEELGTANSEVEDERSRLAELLREAGRLRARRINNTLGLLMHPKAKQSVLATPGQNAASVSVSVKG